MVIFTEPAFLLLLSVTSSAWFSRPCTLDVYTAITSDTSGYNTGPSTSEDPSLNSIRYNDVQAHGIESSEMIYFIQVYKLEKMFV